MRRGRRSGLYTIAAVHSTTRGPSLGGCRMWGYEDARAAVVDALRLSRAMTAKSAVAGLPLGGGKGVIMLPAGAPPPEPEQRRDALLDFGETVDLLGGRYVTAEDVGHVGRRHDRDRRADRARRGPGAGARRLRRPEPVDRARRRDRDPRDLRARLGHRRPVRAQHRGDRARQRRRGAGPGARRRRRVAGARRRRARRSGRWPRSWARPGSLRRRRSTPASTSSRRARSAGS